MPSCNETRWQNINQVRTGTGKLLSNDLATISMMWTKLTNKKLTYFASSWTWLLAPAHHSAPPCIQSTADCWRRSFVTLFASQLLPHSRLDQRQHGCCGWMEKCDDLILFYQLSIKSQRCEILTPTHPSKCGAGWVVLQRHGKLINLMNLLDSSKPGAGW